MVVWESEALGNVANMSCDKVSVNKLTVKNYISTENMLPDRGGIEIAAKLPTAENVNMFSPGDVLFSNIRTYFKKVWLADRHGGASADVIVFRPRDTKKVVSQYLYYVLSSDSFIESTVTASKGTKMPRGDKDAMLRYTMPLPSFTVQRRIAGILSAYDKLIENNLRRIRNLEEMARTLYREWFVNFRYPGHEYVPLVDSMLGQIPQGWVVKELSELCERMESGGTPKRTESTFWDDGEIDWFKTRELWDGFLFGSEERITNLGLKKSSARLFEPGTILMAIYGSPTVGRLGILTRPSSCNQAALGMVPDNKKISQIFLYFVLMFLREHFNGMAQGAAQQNISKEKVAGTVARVPPRLLISAFDAVVDPIFSQLRVLQEQTANLRRTRDLLLPRLLSGQVTLATDTQPITA